MFGFGQSSYDAVYFIDGMQVVREMLFTEFEALLDGIFYDPDFKDCSCQAVYLKIDNKLNILAAVFFTLDFDEQGQADKRWNIPLFELAESAAYGAKINGKNVRIACHSQCQIAWQQSELWEPDLASSPNILTVLSDNIKANRLGLLVAESHQPVQAENNIRPVANNEDSYSRSKSLKKVSVSTTSVSDEDLQSEEIRRRTAKFMRNLRSRINRLKVLHKRDSENIQSNVVRNERVLRDLNEDSERKLFALQIEHDKRDRELETLRNDHETQLDDAVYIHGLNHEKLRRQLRQEMQQRLIEETSELQAKLEMREVEVHYREEQISRLQDQLSELKRIDVNQKQSVSTFSELEQSGVHFVVELEGVEAIHIPADKLVSYFASPECYLAELLEVDFKDYKRWAAHASDPVCSAKTESGCCHESISVETPQEFVAGVSDRCAKHQVKPASVLGRMQANF